MLTLWYTIKNKLGLPKTAGLISKSYKLKRDLVEQFAEACDKAGVSQAAQLTKMMKEFIDVQKG